MIHWHLGEHVSSDGRRCQSRDEEVKRTRDGEIAGSIPIGGAVLCP